MHESDVTKWGRTSLLAYEESRISDNLRRRHGLMRSFRAHLHDEGFVEVDTPILRYYEDPTDNPPFVTLGPGGWPRLHLRTCPEEYTRRCACVFDKTFEIGKSFRNEGSAVDGGQRIHLPEFTLIELYEVDVGLEDALVRFENLVRSAVNTIKGSGTVEYQGKDIDFGPPFLRLKVLESLSQSENAEAVAFAAEHKAAQPKLIPGEDRILGRLLEAHVKPSLFQPTFLTHFPKSADQLPDCSIANEVQRAELVIAGLEIGEVGALQPDGELLRQHVVDAIRERHGQSASEQLVDVDYVAEINAFGRAVGGGGVGIDRLLMLLCNTVDIREVVWYPFVAKFCERR